MGRVRVGISGWNYAGWRGDFPRGLVQREELAYAASRLTSIEINGSFYPAAAVERTSWREQTPGDFVFAVKGGRFITHMKKLADVEAPLANFFASGLLALGPKLGPVLWQLPPSLGYDEERLVGFFAQLPDDGEAAEARQAPTPKVPEDRALTVAEDDRPIRHALEVRHASFAEPAAADAAGPTSGSWSRTPPAVAVRGEAHERLPLRAAARRRRALRQRLQRGRSTGGRRRCGTARPTPARTCSCTSTTT